MATLASVLWPPAIVPPSGGLPPAAEQQAELRVRIDVKPGDEPTTVDPSRDGMLPVAILSTDDFDARDVEPGSVRFEGSAAAPARSMVDDVDNDGRSDRVFLFRNRDTGIECGDETATLTGRTVDGSLFRGSEEIRTVDC